MEKLDQHKQIVRETLKEVAQMIPSLEGIELQIVLDETNGHYLLFMVGWENNRREYASIIHIDVKPDAKVHIQHDGTDLTIALELVKKGIPKSSIVIAYRSPKQRVFIEEFAQA